MINIKLTLDSHKDISEIEMTGHAGYADSGYDIVCAAVSSQVISVENSIEQLLQVHVNAQVNEVEGGYLKMVIPTIHNKQKKHDVHLLLQHLMFALEVLAENYPEFIKISYN